MGTSVAVTVDTSPSEFEQYSLARASDSVKHW